MIVWLCLFWVLFDQALSLQYNWLSINQMQDNVRVGKESLTKKISYHEQHPKKYSTIQSLQKEPTRKNIKLQYPPKHHLSLNHHKNYPERKLKSLSKHERRHTEVKRWGEGSQPQLSTIDGLLKRNAHHFSKFSLSKEREGQVCKQKYKRSEQICSVIETKKMSSLHKVERKHTDATVSMTHFYNSISSDSFQPAAKHKVDIKQPNLDTIINPSDNYEQQPTLEDVLVAASHLLYSYLAKKEEKVSTANTSYLKKKRQNSLSQLQVVEEKLRSIMQETGEMSLRTLVLFGIVKYQQSKYNDSIMYLTKVLDATDGNLMLIDLPQNPKQQRRGDSHHVNGKSKSFDLNLHAYISLAEAFRMTNNYLCSINALLKWQFYFFASNPSEQAQVSLKGHYQTLQPKEVQTEKEEYKQSQRLKKKSYLLVNLQNDNTINKLKKYSNIQNQSSIEFNPSKKTNPSNKPKLDLDEEQSLCAKTTINKEQELLESPNQVQVQYRKEITMIYLLLARLYVNIKSYQSAANYYKTCLNFNPHKIEAILELASLYYTQKGYKVCLQWLQTSISSFEKEKEHSQRWELDIGYLRYYRALILLEEGRTEESYRQLCELKVKQLSSEVNYYKGVLLMRKLAKESGETDRNKALQSILMHFNESIAGFTSQQYLSKSFFQILVILLFEKKDYYGAQYELARYRKMIPAKAETFEEPFNILKKQIKIYDDEEILDPKESRVMVGTQRQGYFAILSDLTEAVICILKMKIAKGLTIIKEIGLRLESESQELVKCFGPYYNHLVKVVLQFKFYAYYILREYEMSLKHVNKLLQVMSKEEYFSHDSDRKGSREVETKLLNINRLMLECMILMKQTKYNYAMSKLKEIECMINQGNGGAEQQAINSNLIVNNFNMVKSLCYINIYSQLEQEKRDSNYHGDYNRQGKLNSAEKEKKMDNNDDNNKEILLSAEELLRHCLISDKENSLIYYLIAIIHYELQSYESSLKYIRQALQYSDDHMIKHYFAKANTKALMGRYDQAIKDYTNAMIVYKEQNKNETTTNEDSKIKGLKLKEQQMEQYYQEKQVMIKEIYLNRAIVYLKQAYALGKHSKYLQNANAISSYRLKASEDLLKYFNALLDSKIDLNQQREIREKLLLFMHTDDPHQAIELGKKFIPRMHLLNDQDHICIYYLTKELNNCISHLKTVIRNLEEKVESRENEKLKKDSLPAKYKKISVALPKNAPQNNSDNVQRLLRLKLDLKCLEALKKSSSRSQGVLQESLIQLLELTEHIYKQKQEQLNLLHKDQQSTVTLQELLTSLCGEIFRWSDILFFIGVIHYQLSEYETAIKYFEESYNQKKMSGTLYSLGKYLNQRQQGSDEEEQERNQDLQPLFQNRVYSKEEIEYNLGLCYLMLQKYKQAYYYLQAYPRFLQIIKKGITDQNNGNQENQFISEEKPNPKEIFIDDQFSSQSQKSERILKKNAIKKRKAGQFSIEGSRDEMEESQRESRMSEENKYPNITPFPIRNRLCSIYSSRTIEKYSFNLSFCLPKIALPTLSTFYEEEIEVAKVVEEQDQSMSEHSEVERLKDSQQDCNRYRLNRDNFESAVKHLSLLDLQMKPIAPWIRQNVNGIIFTQNLINESIELNSERADKQKDKAEGKEGRKGKKDRYSAEECKE